jgi:uncharacterized protein (TIGR02757 family)
MASEGFASRSPTLGPHLEELARRFPYERSLAWDPVRFLQPYRGRKQSAEILGLVASTVAIGHVKAIKASLEALLDRIGPDPEGFLESFPVRDWRTHLAPWRHRWIRADQMGFLFLRLRELYAAFPGGLEEVFRQGLGPEGDFAPGLSALSRALREGSSEGAPARPEPPAGYRALFPDPAGAGRPACKRLCLFVRWMVRRPPPDLGVWRSVSPAILRIPLDTHVYWIARHLGLTKRRTRGWRTVEEITQALRTFDPQDPVRYDFVLAHTGISGDCPKARDPGICGSCAVQPDCDLWRGRPRRGAGRASRNLKGPRVRPPAEETIPSSGRFPRGWGGPEGFGEGTGS